MSELSSETLFHYVREKQYLVNILQNNFRPRFVKEEFHFQKDNLKELAIPVLCFCDIKLSNIAEHVKWYGSYGIGMKKEWALSKGFTPVHYYNSESHVLTDYADAFSSMRNNLSQNEVILDSYIKHSYNSWFMKPYIGEQYNIFENELKVKKFYDEREWRYIPSWSELKNLSEGIPISIVGEKLDKYNNDLEYRNDINEKLGESINLDFKPEDISYIIIKSEAERQEMIDDIKASKSKFSPERIELVFSKIISLEQIESDF